MSSEGLSNERSLAARKLLLEYGDFLLDICRRRLPEEDAWDVFQGLFLKIQRKGLPTDINTLRAYLYQTTINAIRDHARKEKTYKEKIHDSTKHNKLKSSGNPSLIVMQRDLVRDAIDRMERHLSPTIYQVFVHKYKHGLENQEIAEIMSITIGTVARYLSLGTQLIQELYDHYYGDHHG